MIRTWGLQNMKPITTIQENPPNTHTHTHTHTYIYIYGTMAHPKNEEW